MKFYKVVTKRDHLNKDLRSAVICHKFAIKYKTQRWRRPILKNSKIFVFDTLENAITFMKKQYTNTLSIYECEVENPVKATFYSFLASDEDIKTCWTSNIHTNAGLPSGTYHVDAIKLTKRVG